MARETVKLSKLKSPVAIRVAEAEGIATRVAFACYTILVQPVGFRIRFVDAGYFVKSVAGLIGR